MIIVKMNDTTVECSIAASELHEIGLTPEAVINGEENTTSFFAKLNKEVGQQLGYNPETEVMMMSKNMMMDGSIRIFAVKIIFYIIGGILVVAGIAYFIVRRKADAE